MKKNSLTFASFIIVVVLTLSLSACSRKVGCYWSLARDPEPVKNMKSPERSSYPVDMKSFTASETTSTTQTCD